jgi:RNA polymerase sigma-70 factor (ECF subfamily)
MSDDRPGRLSAISTLWSVLRQAHEGDSEAATDAQQLVMGRYGEAVRRYLLATLRDPHAADELTQEFALSLVRGAFRGADPTKGRFRDYVKTTLFHLVSTYRRKRKKDLAAVDPDGPALANVAAPEENPDAEFDRSWREDLLDRTWDALADAQPFSYAVLRFRASHQNMPSVELAQQLARRLNKPLSAAGVRQALHRARSLFAGLLVEEVARSLEQATPDAVEEEMRELGMLDYCRLALDRYRRDHPAR